VLALQEFLLAHEAGQRGRPTLTQHLKEATYCTVCLIFSFGHTGIGTVLIFFLRIIGKVLVRVPSIFFVWFVKMLTVLQGYRGS
jgi:hypothetical protein